MCWFDYKLTKKIANKDIICYKEVCPIYKRSWKNLWRKQLVGAKSLFLGYHYHVNKLNPEISLKVVSNDNIYYINEGYHSYIKVPILDILLGCKAIVKCIIPKGTTYYISDRLNHYVSENIIITDKIIK